MPELEQVLAERNAMALRITKLESALEVLANIANEVIEQKCLGWAKHYEALPIQMLYREDGKYTMPTIAHCLRAKHLVEGGD
jgi:hypothetical protein